MRTVKNLSASPLRIPLPAGKTLHLGPGMSASIRDGDTAHPALMKLCDDRVIELGAVTAGGRGASGFADPNSYQTRSLSTRR
jgi:hypothetical protein